MLLGPRYKICRRLGAGVFDKCQTQAYVLSEARHGKASKGKRSKALSDFGRQLVEKQKVRFAYGITERQLSRYVAQASQASASETDPATRLVQYLETRLDNVVYRSGLAPTRRAARQMVAHGHIVVNGHRTTSPSYALTPKDTFSVREGTRTSPLIEGRKEDLGRVTTPSWLSFNANTLTGKVTTLPSRDLTDAPGDVGVVLEFYSR